MQEEMLNEKTEKGSKRKRAWSALCVIFIIAIVLSAALFASNAQGHKLASPKIMNIYNTENCIGLRWSEVENASGYIIYRNIGNGWKEYARTSGKKSVKFIDEKVRTMRLYSYKVCAVRGTQKSEVSKKAEYRFIEPTFVKKVKPVKNGLKVTWKTRSKGGYNIYRREAGSNDWNKVKSVKKSSVGSFIDRTVKSGKSYVYTVRRVNGGSLSAYKDGKNSVKYISGPSKIYVRNSPKGVRIDWQKVSGADKYIVYRKVSGGKWKKIASIKPPHTGMIDKKAKYSKLCSYCVRTVSGGFKSAFSQKKSLWAVNPNKKMIALTYDDGPYSDVTNHILSVLKKYNSRATFFVVGSRLDAYSNTLKKERKFGCEIGIHTYNHTILTGVSSKKIRSEVNSTADKIKAYTGTGPAAVRAPGGAVNDKVRENVGYPLFNWSVDTLDWKYRNASSVINHVKSGARDGSIVLMHDLYYSTGEAADTIIPWLVKKGYQLVTVSEMMDTRGVKLSNGGLYCSAYPAA